MPNTSLKVTQIMAAIFHWLEHSHVATPTCKRNGAYDPALGPGKRKWIRWAASKLQQSALLAIICSFDCWRWSECYLFLGKRVFCGPYSCYIGLERRKGYTVLSIKAGRVFYSPAIYGLKRQAIGFLLTSLQYPMMKQGQGNHSKHCFKALTLKTAFRLGSWSIW